MKNRKSGKVHEGLREVRKFGRIPKVTRTFLAMLQKIEQQIWQK